MDTSNTAIRQRQQNYEFMRNYQQERKDDPHFKEIHTRAARKASKIYAQRHPEIVHDVHQRRLQRVYDAEGTFTWQEFHEKCAAQNWTCTYCKQEKPLVPDHMNPLSRGGNNTIDNITPSCKSCNSRKGNKTFDEFVAQLSILKGNA